MEKLKEVIKRLISEDEGSKLCARGKAAAKKKYDVYPSAYANGYAVRVCKGQVTGSDGVKKTAKKYTKEDENETTKEVVENDDEMYEEYKKFLKELIDKQEICGCTKEINESDDKKKNCTANSRKGKYKGKQVDLYSPFRSTGGNKKFTVYVCSKSNNVVKLGFGAKGYKVKNNDPEARKNFKQRHNCSEKKDKTKAGYWSCNVGRYAKQLGLSSSEKW